jgi:hypothetical protein
MILTSSIRCFYLGVALVSISMSGTLSLLTDQRNKERMKSSEVPL